MARAGRGTVKPAAESDPMAQPVDLDSFGGPVAPAPEPPSGSNAAAVAMQESYNDVFFLRRSAGNSPPVTAQQKIDEHVEAKEISEVSEIPEIREVAAAPIVGAEQDAAPVVESNQQEDAGQAVLGAPGQVGVGVRQWLAGDDPPGIAAGPQRGAELADVGADVEDGRHAHPVEGGRHAHRIRVTD